MEDKEHAAAAQAVGVTVAARMVEVATVVSLVAVARWVAVMALSDGSTQDRAE